jgi:hypothetical protein
MSFKDKELYTETVVAAYRRLMDIAFWDPAAADQEDDTEPKGEEDK